MMWDEYRKTAGNKAGGLWKAGNIALIAKSFWDNSADISGVIEEPYDLIAGGVFLYASDYMQKHGDKHKGVVIGQGLASVAYMVLMVAAISEGKTKSAIGAGVGVIATAWTTATAANKLLSSKQEKQAELTENKKSLFSEYPLFPPMALEFASNVAFIVGNALDGQIFYSAVGTIWGLAAAHLGISKQQDQKPSDLKIT